MQICYGVSHRACVCLGISRELLILRYTVILSYVARVGPYCNVCTRRCLQRNDRTTPLGKKMPGDKLSGSRIGERRAASPAGLRGQGLTRRERFLQTPTRCQRLHLFSVFRRMSGIRHNWKFTARSWTRYLGNVEHTAKQYDNKLRTHVLIEHITYYIYIYIYIYVMETYRDV